MNSTYFEQIIRYHRQRPCNAPDPAPVADSPLAALLLLHGSAGIYEIAIEFAGVSRMVMLDTGSPLSWVPEAITDRQLRMDGATDGVGRNR